MDRIYVVQKVKNNSKLGNRKSNVRLRQVLLGPSRILNSALTQKLLKAPCLIRPFQFFPDKVDFHTNYSFVFQWGSL